MSKIKIAVIGSCVSRDGFNSEFIENYKDYYQCVLTQNHMSMLSLVSDPVPFIPKNLDGNITDFNKQILITELTKGVWDSLKIQEPDYLILDFYADVYFGIRKVGNSCITDKTWLFKESPLFHTLDLKDTIKINKNYEEFIRVWRNSIDEFMRIMEKEFPSIKIIVNKVHFTDFYIPKNGGELIRISETGKYKKIDVDQINQWLDEFYQYFEDHYDVEFIEYDKEYYSYEEHKWDYFYVHYTNDFYEDFTSKLISIILDDLYNAKQKEKSVYVTDLPKNNLIRNSTFNMGNSFWSYWQDDFKIEKPERDCPSSHILSINCQGHKKDSNRQVWSHPIEINAKGNETFTVSFDLKIHNLEQVDSLKVVFSLRTFNKVEKVLQKDCVWYKNIKFEDIENLAENKWFRCSYTFKPSKGKFLKVAPYLIRNGNLSWRNIKLEKGEQATEWIPSFKYASNG
ncbi:DUF6270 domain-containing protein [Bacillus salipaludis]|uniref:DUF6270 domain-containing protein n=1 Tax=Bacillus salipaludis TaxID=2547811 RepID=A0AA90QVH2_9BACI|nr:DUF6270 domain-containing protein [Bacillus salipaludis]MDQ6600370.1 DUF6270 domain-containing protein [Bacillus salipaludis]